MEKRTPCPQRLRWPILLLVIGSVTAPLGFSPGGLAVIEGGGLEDPLTADGPYFLSAAPAVDAPVDLTLLVPWTQQTADPPTIRVNPGYDTLGLDLEGELVPDQVKGLALCGPTNAAEPAYSSTCLPLERKECGEPDPGFCAEPPQADDPWQEYDVVIRHDVLFYPMSLRVDLEAPGAPPGSKTLDLAARGASWAETTPDAHAQVALEAVPVDRIEVRADGETQGEHTMPVGTTREFQVLATSDNDRQLSPFQATWSVEGGCGSVEPDVGYTTTFTAEGSDEEDCHVVASVPDHNNQELEARSGAIHVLEAEACGSICETDASDGTIDVRLASTIAGDWTIHPPLLGADPIRIFTEDGEDPLEEDGAYEGPHDGTWTLTFVPSEEGSVPDLNYTIEARIGDEFLKIRPPVVAGAGNLGVWQMSPATWVFNAHKGQSVACAPALPGVCDDADPIRVQDARFFLDEG